MLNSVTAFCTSAVLELDVVDTLSVAATPIPERINEPKESSALDPGRKSNSAARSLLQHVESFISGDSE